MCRKLAARAAALQDTFGRGGVERILLTEPSLLDFTSRRLQHNFEGVQEALQLSPSEAMQLVCAHPTLLRSAPALLRARYAELREQLKVTDAELRRLLMRAPMVLRLPSGRLSELTAWLVAEGMPSNQRAVRTYLSWPQLATTSRDVLASRHRALQQLLGASDEEMRHIVSSYPNLLTRDPGTLAANVRALALLLQLDEEGVLRVMRQQPGLLSYNSSTLATRWSYAVQVLRLPPSMATSLLGINRPLLTCGTQLPARIEAVRQMLGQLPDSQLFPLLHNKLAVLRFPPELLAARTCAAKALASLYGPWASAWDAAPPYRMLEVVATGWGPLFRLAYLLSTGQAGSMAPFAALRAVRAVFERRYPDFPAWLQSYNAAVGPEYAVAASGELMPVGGRRKAGAAAAPIAGAPCGGRYLLGLEATAAAAAVAGGRLGSKPIGASGASAHTAASSSGSGSGSSGGGGSRSSSSRSGGNAPGPLPSRQVLGRQDAILAAWLGLSEPQTREVLQAHPRLTDHSWAEWGALFGAVESLLRQLGRGVEGVRSTQHPLKTAGRPTATAAAAAAAAPGRKSSGEGGAARLGAAGVEVEIVPDPEVARRARRLLSDPATHPSAAPAICVAAGLATFSPGLWRPPPPRGVAPDAVALFVVCPQAWASRGLAARCRELAALAAASPPLAAELRALPVAALGRGLVVPRIALEFLQYLIATSQPQPWAASAKELFKVGRNGRLPPSAVAAYPGFQEWRAGMMPAGAHKHGAKAAAATQT